MEKIKIEEMTLADFEQIEDSLLSDFDDFWSVLLFKKELLAENRKYLVAKQGNLIVGFIGAMINGTEIEIMNVVTKKTERKKGIGSFLLHKMIEFAKNNNIETIFLEVSQGNYIAKKMYEKAGFCEIGLRKNYYHAEENAILMSKKVNNL